MSELKEVYCFITDDAGQFYRANQEHDGSYTITSNTTPFPIKYNPTNLLDTPSEFGTNKKYNSMNRSISHPLTFIKDAAAILRYAYYNGKGIGEYLYLTIIKWNGQKTPGRYELSYKGKFDFSKKSEDPKSASFTIPTKDDTAWGVLSEADDIEFEIDCSPNNPKSVPVLFDGITLVNKYTFHTVQAPIRHNSVENTYTIPLVLVNQDGDSAGIIAKSQSLERYSNWLNDHQATSKAGFFEAYLGVRGVNITGTFVFEPTSDTSPAGGLIIYFVTSKNQRHEIFNMSGSNGVPILNKIYSVDFNFNIDLDVSENIFFLAILNDTAVRNFTITPITSTISVSIKTKPEPVVAYGLRPLDLAQAIVNKATHGRYTINSNFFVANNKSICISGDSLRGVQNAKLYTNFQDFFETFDAINFLALRSINGSLWIEKFIEVYKQNGVLIDIGEILDVELDPADDMYASEIEVGSPDQDLRHPSGRLEFNSTNKFNIPIPVTNKQSYVSKYRLGCYDITFLLLDYQGGSTKDNSGDKSVFVVDITDEQASTVDNIETFENIDIDDAPLQPIIKSPLTTDVIPNLRPTIKGIALVNQTVNIYIDDIFEGSCVSDNNGNWLYDVTHDLTAFNFNTGLTGVHTVEATFGNSAAPRATISVTIDLTNPSPIDISYPRQNSSLYNNKPLIKGVAPANTNINIFDNGIFIGNTIADGSCKWEFKSSALQNGSHTISITNGAQIVFNVDTNVSHPLITYIGGELDGGAIFNNMPLVQGVAQPNTAVTLWLNYIQYVSIGTSVSDANGNWSIQLAPTNYIDPLSGLAVVLVPVQNGLNIFATSLINFTVGINVTGYKLNRPNFTSITGVTDNTVFNVNFSPARMLKNHFPIIAAMMDRLQQDRVRFGKPAKNANLVTNLNGVVVSERADIPTSALGTPIAVLEYANIKTIARNTFAQALNNFNSGGIVRGSYKGTLLYFLPYGSMKMNSIVDSVQDWKLLLSPLTTYAALSNLYKNGLIINIMKNSFYRSDYNSLHFVEYNKQIDPKFNFQTIYENWFENRNNGWSTNPKYVQKYQRTELITDQIISDGLSGLTLRMYRCSDASIIDTIPYNAVNPAPIQGTSVVLEAKIDFSIYPEGRYFFVLMVGSLMACISERVHVKEKWEKTILIEASKSINSTAGFFSTGFKTVIRVEGIVKKWQPDVIAANVSSDEQANKNLLHSIISRKRIARFGTAYGLPDYLYLKISECLGMDNLLIENEAYTLEDGEKIQPQEEYDGHPLYCYSVTVMPAVNTKGNIFSGGVGSDLNGGTILVVDGSAIGLPPGQLYNISLDNG